MRLIPANMVIFLKIAFICISLSLFSCGERDSINDTCIDEASICDSCACTYEYAPVCGCDGKTYGNSCAADVNGVISYTEGECGAR